jgi:YesN/AraC family two-component response regulator
LDEIGSAISFKNRIAFIIGRLLRVEAKAAGRAQLRTGWLLLCKNCLRQKQDSATNWQRAQSTRGEAAFQCNVMIPLPTDRTQPTYARQLSRAEPVEIWKARKFIEQHLAEELSLTKVAKVVNISANYLSEKFKQVTGVNFVDYIARARFENATHLLEDVDVRISEIAFAVGFQSLSQFNRVFKKLLRKSPTEFRASLLKRSKVRRVRKSDR